MSVPKIIEVYILYLIFIFFVHFSSETFLSSSLSRFFWHAKIQGEHKAKMEKCRKVRLQDVQMIEYESLETFIRLFKLHYTLKHKG